MEYIDYLHDIIEYPSSETVMRGLELGTGWCYISHTYLNGLINYVEIVQAFVISRYTSRDTIISVSGVREPAGESKYTKRIGSKLDMIKLCTQKGRVYHTKLHMFDDDVLILAKSDKDYYTFWFDGDVSDCCISLLDTNIDSEDTIKTSFTKYVISTGRRMSSDYLGKIEDPIELPLHFFEGWLSF